MGGYFMSKQFNGNAYIWADGNERGGGLTPPGEKS